MSRVALNGVVLLKGVDLSCYLKNIKVDGAADVLDATTLCSTGSKQFAKGLIERTISAGGFFKYNPTDASENIEGLFAAAVNDSSGNYLISIGGEGGGSAGQRAFVGNLKVAKYEIDATIGQLLMIAFEGKTSKTDTAAQMRAGLWLCKQTFTGATTTTTVDFGAAALRYAFNIHNYGGGGATVQVFHSVNGSTWVSLYSAVVAINTAVQVSDEEISARRYWRAIVTPSGASAKVGIAVATGNIG